MVDRSPFRVCGLTDMDAFYAACEQNRLKLDPGNGKFNYRFPSGFLNSLEFTRDSSRDSSMGCCDCC